MKSWTHSTSPFPRVTPGIKRQSIWSTIIYSYFVAQPFDQKLESLLIYLFYLHTTIRLKYMVLFHLLFRLCTIIRPKIRVLIDLFLLFVHSHSTKSRGHSYSLFNLFLSWLCQYFVCYIHDSTALIFRTLYSWLYEILAIFPYG